MSGSAGLQVRQSLLWDDDSARVQNGMWGFMLERDMTGRAGSGCTVPAPGAASPTQHSGTAAITGRLAAQSLQPPALRLQRAHLRSTPAKSASRRPSCRKMSCCRRPSGKLHRLQQNRGPRRQNQSSSRRRSRGRQMEPPAMRRRQPSRKAATLPSRSSQRRQQSGRRSQQQSRLPCPSQRLGLQRLDYSLLWPAGPRQPWHSPLRPRHPHRSSQSRLP